MPAHHRRIIAIGILAATLILVLLAPGAHAHEELAVVVGSSRHLRVQEADRVAVGDPAIADVVVVNKGEVLIKGEAVGRTSLHIWDRRGLTSYNLRVYADHSDLKDEVQEVMALPDIRIWATDNTLILDGTVAHGEERERAINIAGAFADRVVDVMEVADSPRPQRLEDEIQAVIGIDTVNVSLVRDTVFLGGFVETESLSKQAEAVAGAYGRPVVNMLNIGSKDPAEDGVPLAERIGNALDDERIRVGVFNDLVLLEGRVAEEQAKRRAEVVAGAYTDRVVSLIQVGPGRELVADPEVPVGWDGRSMAEAIADIIADPGIEVRVVYDTVFLEGRVADEQDRRRAVALAEAFPHAVVDLLQVVPRLADGTQVGDEAPELERVAQRVAQQAVEHRRQRERIRTAIDDPNINVRLIEETVFLEGSVAEAFAKERAAAIAEAFGLKVVNLLRVPTPYAAGMNDADTDDAAARLAVEVEGELDNPDVSVRVVRGVIFLEGTVTSDQERRRAALVAEAFADEVHDLLEVKDPSAPDPAEKEAEQRAREARRAEEERQEQARREAEEREAERRAVAEREARWEQMAQRIAGAIGEPETYVRVHNEVVFLEGKVGSEFHQQRADLIAQAYAADVRNLLQIRERADQAAEGEGGDDGKLSDAIAAAVSDPGVRVRVLNQTVFLEGVTESTFERDRAQMIAEAFSDDVRNLLQVRASTAAEDSGEDVTEEREFRRHLREQIAAGIGDPGIRVRVLNETVFLEGLAAGDFERDRAEAVARAFTDDVENLIQVQEGRAAWDRQQAGESPADERKDSMALLQEEIATAIDDDQLLVRVLNDVVFLEGTVASDHSYQRAESIAKAYWSKVVNLLQVDASVRPTRVRDDAGDDAAAPVTAPRTDETADQSESATEGSEPGADRLADEQEESALEFLRRLGDSDVHVWFVGETAVLDGSVDSERLADRVRQLAPLYFTEYLDLVRIPEEPGPPSLSEEIAAAIGEADVRVRSIGDRLILEGTVQDQNQLETALEVAGSFGQEVVNLLDVTDPFQVLLEVRVAEITEAGLEKLGVSWGSMRGVDFEPGLLKYEVLDLASLAFQRMYAIAARLDALVEEQEARLLAVPALLSESGKAANFLVGGEIPIAIGDNVVWREYGVRLNFLPEVRRNGDVSLEVAPEVSSLDWGNSVETQGSTIPALRSRRVETSVRVPEGATFVLGGLLETRESEHLRKVPVLGDIPILGALFRSTEFQEGTTELVIFVTPTVLGADRPAPWDDVPDQEPMQPEEDEATKQEQAAVGGG